MFQVSLGRQKGSNGSLIISGCKLIEQRQGQHALDLVTATAIAHQRLQQGCIQRFQQLVAVVVDAQTVQQGAVQIGAHSMGRSSGADDPVDQVTLDNANGRRRCCSPSPSNRSHIVDCKNGVNRIELNEYF